MLLKSIHIDGFGIFNDKHVTGLKKGVNIIYGPNEFGKTTLLEFIRRILFGFPGKRAPNQYPAINGGQYGGRLLCELKSGEEIEISRTEGTHGGPLNLLIGSDEKSGKDCLNPYLGSISETFYKNVYAFSLSELEEVESLKAEEISNRIYGAGLELGGKSLTEIKKTFRGVRDTLFKKSGSANELAKSLSSIKEQENQIRELQKGLSEYESLKSKKEEIESEVTEAKRVIKELNEKKYYLENLEKLFPAYIRMKQAKANLDDLGDVDEIAEDAVETSLELQREIDGLQISLDEKQGDLDSLIELHDSVQFNENILSLESKVLELQTSEKSYSDARQDTEKVSIERARLESEINTEISKLGPDWDQSKVKDFSVTTSQDDSIRTAREKLEKAERDFNNAEIKLEQHRDGVLQGFGAKTYSSKLFKNAHLVIVALGVVGTVYGFYVANWPLLILSGITALIGGVIAFNLKTDGGLDKVDSGERRLNDNLEANKDSLSAVRGEWGKELAELGLENLSPNGFEKIIPNIESIKTKIDSKSSLDERLERMKATIDRVESTYADVLKETDSSKFGKNIETNITLIINQFDDAKEGKREKENLEGRQTEVNSKIKTNIIQLKKKVNELKKYIEKTGAVDLDDLKKKNELYSNKVEYETSVEEDKNAIQSIVGLDKKYEDFLLRVEASSLESIKVEIDENNQELEDLTARKEQLNIEIGGVNTLLESLANDEALIKIQTDLEIQKTLLREKSREWAKAQIALKVFNKAIAKYESTRQPDVINMAQSVFSDITDSKYPELKMLAENQELIILDQNKKSKKVAELSRGSMEELYFSMRLGLIDVYEKRAEPMPFVMDDTFVNFDDSRRDKAINALQEFAKNRQVIVLTCHAHVNEMFKSIGANILSV